MLLWLLNLALGGSSATSGFQAAWVQFNESIGNMKKNTASQIISAQMITISDGSDQTTGTCNVAVEVDGAAGTGGTATHIANGKWEYAPIQADTNGDNLTFQFVITGAITVTKDVFTSFPQTVDNDVLAAGAAGFAAIDTAVGALNDFNPASDDVAVVTLVTTTTTNTDMVGTANAATATEMAKVPKSDGTATWNSTALASINAEADTALTDYDPPTRTEATSDKDEIITDLDDIKGTGFVKDTHSLFDIEGYVDILDDGTSGNAKIATDVAATLADTNELQVDNVPGLIAALNDFNPASDDVAVVTLVNTTTDVTNQVSADMTAISGDSGAADNLEASMETLVLGTATGTPTTTTMADSTLTEATNDHYNGRVILWRTGALLGQATVITGYNGTTKTFTFTAVTNAASASDAYVVV